MIKHRGRTCREEQKATEQKERQEERARREKEAKGPPFMQQIYACEQLLGWCRQYQKAGAADAEARCGGVGEAPAAFEGMVAMSKKADDDGGDVLSTSRTKSARPSKRPMPYIIHG